MMMVLMLMKMMMMWANKFRIYTLVSLLAFPT